MQERVARDKTCPFIQHAGLVSLTVPASDATALKDKHVPANIDCITTSCMAWGKRALHDDGAGYCKLIEDK